MHIHMSYCTFSGFQILASNYLDLDTNQKCKQYDEIKELMGNVNVTPAQIAEELMKHEDVDEALDAVIVFLKQKMEMASNEVKEDGEKCLTNGNGISTGEGTKGVAKVEQQKKQVEANGVSDSDEETDEEVQDDEEKEVKVNGVERELLKLFRKMSKSKRNLGIW